MDLVGAPPLSDSSLEQLLRGGRVEVPFMSESQQPSQHVL